jgi:predicted N-acetyltransferase YhbS
MTIRRTIITAASALAFLGTAHASELKQIEPQDIDLGEVSGVVYYTAEPDGFHLVATLAQGAIGTPVRLQAVLLSGQSVVLSTPRAPGLAPVAVKISRQGNGLVVEEPATN